MWPDLKQFVGITGDQVAVSVPKITHLLGPSVTIKSHGYGSAECGLARVYPEGNPNTDFKVTFRDGVGVEFLDVRSNEPSDRVLPAVGITDCILSLSSHPPLVGTRNWWALRARRDDPQWLVEIPRC